MVTTVVPGSLAVAEDVVVPILDWVVLAEETARLDRDVVVERGDIAVNGLSNVTELEVDSGVSFSDPGSVMAADTVEFASDVTVPLLYTNGLLGALGGSARCAALLRAGLLEWPSTWMLPATPERGLIVRESELMNKGEWAAEIWVGEGLVR